MIILVDGWWESWSSWSECSASCDGGTQWRVRQCTGTMHGGKDCEGLAGGKQACNTDVCPGENTIVLKLVVSEKARLFFILFCTNHRCHVSISVTKAFLKVLSVLVLF